MIGQGLYQWATRESARAANAKLILAHLCPQVMRDWRTYQPWGISIWRGDPGDDGRQFDRGKPADTEARRFFDLFVGPMLASLPPGTASIIHGPNEAWPDRLDRDGLRWRATFELALTRIVQNEARLLYAALACSVGNLEADALPLFADVFREAYCINYHGYIRPWGKTVDDRVDCPWYVWRPLAIWAPRLRELGIRNWRLLYGECGTFYSPPVTGLSREDEVRLCIEIDRQMAAACASEGIAWIGAIPYGYGMVTGNESPWELEGTEALIAAEQSEGGHMPTVGEGFRKVEQYIGPWLEDEIYHRSSQPDTVSLALGQKGWATWSKLTNETIAYTYAGRVYRDYGNSGDGTMKLVDPKA
ncbi:MAG: hypothetical protein V2A73_08670 [Pseudomonadota bacterium]